MNLPERVAFRRVTREAEVHPQRTDRTLVAHAEPGAVAEVAEREVERLRGDLARITLGPRVNLQDGCIVHADTDCTQDVGEGVVAGLEEADVTCGVIKSVWETVIFEVEDEPCYEVGFGSES